MKPLPGDLEALAAGGKAALARCLTALDSQPEDPALIALLEAAWRAPRGTALGLTGPPGVGKSTLTNALLARFRGRGETVAVLAVDPSSPLTGGALLGDRARIETDPDDAGAFVRSMAARGRLGGLADGAFPAIVLLRAMFDWVVVETVGVGQSEIEIADCADVVVLCIQPGSGDALQFMKAGVMEVPDLLVVTKGDLGAPARRAAADLRGALSLAAEARSPEVLVVSARSGEGLEAAVEAVTGLRREAGEMAQRRAAQARAWAEGRLLDSFGRVGLGALGPRLLNHASPFAALAGVSERARSVLHETLKNI